MSDASGGRGRRRTEGRSPQPPVAAPAPSTETQDVAAGPSTAAPPERSVEAPVAPEAPRDATSPTSGDRSGPTGSKAGPGGTLVRPAEAGGSTSAVPTMPGPSGVAPTTESVGDPGAGSAAEGAAGGAAAGATIGGGVAGPVGLVVGASVGAVAGAAEGVDDDEPPPPGPFGVPGGGGTGPVDPIYDVARIQRQLEERRRP